MLDVTETAALAAKKAATVAASIPSVVPLPRPRPLVTGRVTEVYTCAREREARFSVCLPRY